MAEKRGKNAPSKYGLLIALVLLGISVLFIIVSGVVPEG